MSGPMMRTHRRASVRDREIAGCVQLRPCTSLIGFSSPADAVPMRRAHHGVGALLASELTANGCMRRAGRVHARVRISESSMTQCVSTTGAWSEGRSVSASAEAEKGRGPTIVRALAESLLLTSVRRGRGSCQTVVCRASRIDYVFLPQGSR